MSTYILTGVIHPERAIIENHEYGARFTHVATQQDARMTGRILMNNLVARVVTDAEWDLFDLRNIVMYLTQTELSFIGFIKGFGYRPEIVRVTNEELDVDLVYGIDVPCIAERTPDINYSERLRELKELCVGEAGVYIQRCLNDLMLAIRYPEDTAFFCYRAIESLKNYHKRGAGLENENAASQWTAFREFTGCSRDDIDIVKADADPIRHSDDLLFSRNNRESLFTATWDIVEAYLHAVKNA